MYTCLFHVQYICLLFIHIHTDIYVEISISGHNLGLSSQTHPSTCSHVIPWRLHLEKPALNKKVFPSNYVLLVKIEGPVWFIMFIIYLLFSGLATQTALWKSTNNQWECGTSMVSSTSDQWWFPNHFQVVTGSSSQRSGDSSVPLRLRFPMPMCEPWCW